MNIDPFSQLNRSIKGNMQPLNKLEYLTAMLAQPMMAGESYRHMQWDVVLSVALTQAKDLIKACAEDGQQPG